MNLLSCFSQNCLCLSLQETLDWSFFPLQSIQFKISSHRFIQASSNTFCYQGSCKMDHYTLPCQFGSSSDFNTCMCGFDTSQILSYMLQGSSRQFWFFLYYSPLTSWKQEDKHRTSPANYYSIWNKPSRLSEASPNLQGWCCPCHNHPDYKLSQNAAQNISLENSDNLSFQCNIWWKGVKFTCLILSQRTSSRLHHVGVARMIQGLYSASRTSWTRFPLF